VKKELRPKEAGTFALSCLFVFTFVAALRPLRAFEGRSPKRTGNMGERIAPQAKPKQDRIALYKKFLLGPDPKPEKSEERRIAILSLVRNPDPRAHSVLQEVLALAGNPVRVPISTLEKICEALTEQEILDLGTNPLVSLNPEALKKLEIYRSYVPVMIALRAKKVGEKPSVLQSIHRFFLLLPPKLRREVLSREITNKDPKLQASALRIGGITRDPELAPFLAPLLSQKELRPIAQESLARLTLRSELFGNLKEFKEWYSSHKGKSYEALAEESLLSKLHNGKKAEVKFRKTALSFAKKALELGLRVRPLPWESFQLLLGQVEEPKDRALLGQILFQGLRLLSGRTEQSGPWKATDPGLKDFFQFARGEYKETNDPKRKGIWLSLSTLLGKALGGKASDWARLTLESLLRGKVPFDLKTALSLLALFPVDDAREAILKFIESEMRPNLPLASRADILGFAIEILGKMGAPKDRVLLKGIRELSLKMVRKKGFPMKLREAALDLGGKLDGPGVLEGFKPIVLSGSDQIPSSLRMRAFGWVETLGTGMLQAEKGPPAILEAERILSFFFQCLGDPEPRLREQVCKALEAFPPSPKNFPQEKRREWGGRILGRVGKRLREETEPHVIDSLRKVFGPSLEGDLLGATVLEHFVGVLLHWGEKRRVDYEKLLPAFLGDLQLLLKRKGIQPKTLVAFSRSLKNAGLRRPSAMILEAPSLVALDRGAEALPENQRVEALQIRKERASLLLALILEDGLPGDWSDAKRKTLVQRILGARNGLVDLAQENPMALFYLGWAELFGGKAEEAEILFKRFREGKPVAAPKIMDAAGLFHAKALLRIGKPKAAASLLSQRKDLEGMLLLLEARKATGDFAGVVSLIRDLLQSPSLPASGPKRVDLLLDLVQAQIGLKDLKGARETAKSLPLLTRDSAKMRLKMFLSEIRTLTEKLKKKKAETGKGQGFPQKPSSQKASSQKSSSRKKKPRREKSSGNSQSKGPKNGKGQ
jgi:hypothetical protein